jgi:hypothetical protein
MSEHRVSARRVAVSLSAIPGASRGTEEVRRTRSLSHFGAVVIMVGVRMEDAAALIDGESRGMACLSSRLFSSVPGTVSTGRG